MPLYSFVCSFFVYIQLFVFWHCLLHLTHDYCWTQTQIQTLLLYELFYGISSLICLVLLHESWFIIVILLLLLHNTLCSLYCYAYHLLLVWLLGSISTFPSAWLQIWTLHWPLMPPLSLFPLSSSFSPPLFLLLLLSLLLSLSLSISHRPHKFSAADTYNDIYFNISLGSVDVCNCGQTSASAHRTHNSGNLRTNHPLPNPVKHNSTQFGICRLGKQTTNYQTWGHNNTKTVKKHIHWTHVHSFAGKQLGANLLSVPQIVK